MYYKIINLLIELRVTQIIFLFSFIGSIGYGQNLKLQIEGDSDKGYLVGIYNGNKLIVKNSEEFSLEMYNLDMSIAAKLEKWTGQELEW